MVEKYLLQIFRIVLEISFRIYDLKVYWLLWKCINYLRIFNRTKYEFI